MISDGRRDYYAGTLMILIGVGAAYLGSTYQVGTLTRMGPGYFPLVLGVLLTFLGILIALSARRSAAEEPAGLIESLHSVPAHPDWRGWSCVIGSVVSFIVLAEYAGLLPATFACVFIGAMGDRTATLKVSALLASGISVFALVLFAYILHVQIPIVRGF
ncbi:MAG: tripartite tricarboxylate transporter TctB [Hyphomicrobiales bacterium]|nr:tripartite tricarboxylate transporter TctB [Hyphomicrobiales bacterium]